MVLIAPHTRYMYFVFGHGHTIAPSQEKRIYVLGLQVEVALVGNVVEHGNKRLFT